ncbi:MAG TPA: LacI family DNA-binding transcriptional regulator [Pseudonocardiaceae bacterium]|nr:LacI family DNA-binding transcriptional regulator [Pseudonocardiaceae bacterium]
MAKRAGVSLGTVSNVLNRPERVGQATKDKVLRAIEELGFVRNEAARQLRAGRSRTIGLLVLDVGNPFFTDIAAGVEEMAASAGLSVLLCNSAERQDREDHYLSVLEEQRALGILISPVSGSTPHLGEIRERGMPAVLVDHRAPRRQCSVSVDDVVGGEIAVAHLIESGYERVAFVGGPTNLNQVADRLAGARKAWQAAGRDDRKLTVLETTALNVASGRQMGERIAAMPARRRPNAVFCANDLLALGVLQEMTRQGLVVPGDIAIVGYDDIDFAAAAAVPLTSVRQPRAQLGRAATELLIEEISAPETHRHRQVVFEPELVVRASTRA